jgi:formylglycine-generating enzyme
MCCKKEIMVLFLPMIFLLLSCNKEDDSNTTPATTAGTEVLLPAGEFEMGDHFGFVDPNHPTDELPVHLVKVNSFYIGTTEITNGQFLEFLNDEIGHGLIEVKNNVVYATGSTDPLYYTNGYASYYSILYYSGRFSIVDFRTNHPVVGVMWAGAAAYCNWMSGMKGLEECYDLSSGDGNFSKNGYRLPTEAEWEYAARGGNTDPYYNYPDGNTIDIKSVNLPGSGDPYESQDYPNTTPVAFYDGKLKNKTDYNWPGSMTAYQTSDGKNGFGLYDMQGNVWEFVNDWYGQNYYSISPSDNPTGPASGFIMPDGKPYRGMRGGNWYNGLLTDGINDGHSRVSNRNPSYYRGPQDPNHPYYHLGFRIVRNK